MKKPIHLNFFLLPATLVRLIVALGSVVLVMTLFIAIVMNYQRTSFNINATNAISQINESLIINDAALSGFSSLLNAIGAGNLQAARNFTQRMRDAYPHIYMFEALVSVDPEKKAAHEASMHAAGYPDYKLTRYVSKKTPTGKLFNTIDDVPMLYPIFFIDPYLDSVKGLMGFDMLSARKMREPLLASLAHGEAVASEPYKLREGGRGYVLVKAIDTISADGPSYQEGGLAVLLLIKTDTMLASVVDMIPSASLSLMYGEDRKIAAEKILPNPDTRPLIELQTLTIEREFYELGQPFTLLLEQKMGLYSSHLQLMVLLSFLIFGGYGLLYRVRFSKYGLKLQRDAAVLELAQQHSHLETMVAQRTRELQRKSDENKRLSQQLIRVQEDQYHHIARELHDEFGQTLTAIKINAHILENTETVAGVSIYAQEITTQADALYETMRDLIQRLRPEALDMFGLKVALEQCLLAFRLHEQNVELQLVIDDAVSDMAEIYTITSYRIVQELVNNAVKYSQQTQLKVELVVNDDGLNICVVDDGIGFDPLQSKVGFGLSSVEERVRSLGGYVDIKTEANKGVNVCIQIPLQELKGKPVN